jgi:plasmid stabilization system protein ParE
MAKRIAWTLRAKQRRREILDYWFQRTGNKKYSRKLAGQIRETAFYISENQYLGRSTSIPDVRIAISGNYLIVYKVYHDFIEIFTIFDSRQNPNKLIIE